MSLQQLRENTLVATWWNEASLGFLHSVLPPVSVGLRSE